METQEAQYEVEFTGGSLWMVRPLNDSARENLVENVSEEAQWWGEALVVEHRYIGALVEQLSGEGWRVRVL